jgi:hypothetical protein
MTVSCSGSFRQANPAQLSRRTGPPCQSTQAGTVSILHMYSLAGRYNYSCLNSRFCVQMSRGGDVLQPEREQLAGTAGARPTHLRHYHARPHTRHLGLQHAHYHRTQPARHGQSHQHCPPG